MKISKASRYKAFHAKHLSRGNITTSVGPLAVELRSVGFIRSQMPTKIGVDIAASLG